jgi:hypothetical protein
MVAHKKSNVQWAFAEATRLVPCESCEARPGCPCVEDNGDPLGAPHPRRLDAYREFVGEEDFALRHTRRFHGKDKP